MVKIVQRARGDATASNAYTGPEGELRVDIDNWDIRIHDGATPGGHVVLNRDNADERYAPNNVEVNGIGPYADGDRGWLVRTAPHVYTLRQLALATTNGLTLSNPAGTAGNPTIDLKDTIVGDRTLDGSVLVTGVMQVNGGINADVSGDLDGNADTATLAVKANSFANGIGGTAAFTYLAIAQPTWVLGTNDGLDIRVSNALGWHVALADVASTCSGNSNTATALTAGNKVISGILDVSGPVRATGQLLPFYDGSGDFSIQQTGSFPNFVRTINFTSGRFISWTQNTDTLTLGDGASTIAISNGRVDINTASFFVNGVLMNIP